MHESIEKYIAISAGAQATLIAGARHAGPVYGLTHGFYKYPARFSPHFARAVIQTFTQEGELVLDPYVGGGTTLVEAIACGRQAVGVDISALATFIARVKATVLSENELTVLEHWASDIASSIDIRRESITVTRYNELGYYKHLDHPSRWRIRKVIEQCLASAVGLGTPRLERFGRCVVLRTAQRALDGRKTSANVAEFRMLLRDTAKEMVCGARELRIATKTHGRLPVKILCRSAAGIEVDLAMTTLSAPKLIVTSPPYPGVHVLYHRWQVDGGKEAPLPFMIANKLDGAGSSYYTMGDRHCPRLTTYFANVRATMSSIASLADRDTVIVQMLAFSEARWQLPRYLKTMEEAGLAEVFLPTLKGELDGRLWRRVPGRRWYSDQRGTTPATKEVVLIHRKSGV